MSYLFLSNCLICGSSLGDASEGHVNFYYCSKDPEHFDFDMTNNLIRVNTDYGTFHFTVNGKEIACAIFHDKTSGQRIWLDSPEPDANLMIIPVKPSVDNIKQIIAKFEIRNIFK